MPRQLLNFFIHLRLHYQFLILSGAYLLAALFVDEIVHRQYWLQFLNVHILLFGSATAYNSWWDKDKGPVGGLKHPPEMQSWMWPASLIMQFAGLMWAFTAGLNYSLIYALSMLFFWLYSSPLARWKGKAVLSFIAIGISTGFNSFLLGFLAAGGFPITITEGLTALGVACIVLSLHPASQVYQTNDDLARGDQTFAAKFGLRAVKWLFTFFFAAGAVFIFLGLFQLWEIAALCFAAVSIFIYTVIGIRVWRLKSEPDEYQSVMRIKYSVSAAFAAFILSALLVKTIIG